MELVSIIIPVYNVEKYLRKCIDSVLHQTYKNLEIILVDDGSPDQSGLICDQYSKQDLRITTLHKKNGGLSSARNAGFSVSHGKYVYFLDSDDYIDNETIELLVNVAEDKNLDMVNFDGIAFIDDNENSCKNETSFLNRYIKKNIYHGVWSGPKLLQNLLEWNDYRSPVQFYFFNRKFLLENQLMFYEDIIHEDELYILFALLCAKYVMHLPFCLYHKRIHSNSIMGIQLCQKNSDSMYVVLQEILNKRIFWESSENTKKACQLAFFRLNKNYCFQYAATLKKQDATGRQQYKNYLKKIKDLNYLQIPELKKYIKKRNIYFIVATIKEFCKKKPFIYNFLCRAKRFTENFRPLDVVCQNVISILKETKKESGRLIILCVPHLHGNRGDLAISFAQRKFLEQNFPSRTIIEIPTVLCEFHSRQVIPYLNSKDIFLVCGGGWFGSLWRHNEIAALNILRHFNNNRIIIFPQTVYYTQDAKGKQEFNNDYRLFSKMNDLHVFVRGQSSYEFIHKMHLFKSAKNVHLIPDMVLSLDMQHLSALKRSGILVCLRNDVESVLENQQRNIICSQILREFTNVGFISTNIPGSKVSILDRKNELLELLKKIAASEIVVTDRLHCMIFCAITGTPCLVFDNLTQKVSGTYNWISYCRYIRIVRPDSDIITMMQEMLSIEHHWNPAPLKDYYRQIAAKIF